MRRNHQDNYEHIMLLTLDATRLKMSSLFCNSIDLNVVCSPKTLFMKDNIISSILFLFMYKTLWYASFKSLYFWWVFSIGLSSYISSVILYLFSLSLLSLWLSSVSYRLSTTNTYNDFLFDILFYLVLLLWYSDANIYLNLSDTEIVTVISLPLTNIGTEYNVYLMFIADLVFV